MSHLTDAVAVLSLLCLPLLACQSAEDGGGETLSITAQVRPLDDPEPTTGPGRQDAPDGEGVEGPEEPLEEAAWDVDAPPWETFTQDLDLDQGTWMNLDVSPDGTTLVFDLLGDLYLLPIEGGAAQKLTGGMAWDMQPRFAPDGQSVAFTSDRTGPNGKAGDNLWVMERDAEGNFGEARAITQETFRLVSGPAWTPDGQYLVARKHFSSRRSLGAGEMWLYHRTGVEGGVSAGLQLTERPTDQKDVNEPIFDPTGRYLYYSMDATAGDTFDYNKDSTGQIYIIRRLDLETQETEALITGPGGACRPTPSPDGRTIAFVRRVDGKSALHLYDLESGAVRRLIGGLERDNQEAWAIHGVYPAMAWTPDSASLVYWAGGRIHRVDARTGAARTIPFRVQDTREVSRAVRFPIEVAADTFDVRVCRWVEVSPDGSRVVFQALGHLYLKDLPDGAPRRLTSQLDHFEFEPSWSRDGSQVVYTTWNDEHFGQVRVVPATGGAGRAVVDAPGHYFEPVFSPDGRTIVYRKGRGGSLTSPLWAAEPGIYQVSAEGGASTRVTRSGSRPRFAADGDRVFLQRTRGDKNADNRELFSVDLHGRQERVHATNTWGTEVCVSPDGRWLAFVEEQTVFVAPFVPTGRALPLGPKASSLPVARVAEGAGDFIHFSGDSRTLHWSLGPTLYQRPLAQAFAFLEGAPDPLPEPESEGIHIGFAVPHEQPSGTVALVGGRLVTMVGDQVLEDGVILVQGNRIVAVGPRDQVSVPTDAHVVDLEGRMVLPGLIDTHAHGSMADQGRVPQDNWVDLARLSFGVTTVHDPSNDTHEIFAASEMTKAGLITAPRTFSTGTILYGAAGSYHAEINSLEDARFHVGRMQALGAFSVKSYNQPRRDQRQQVLQAARELGMMVVPEGGSTFMHNLTMVVDGHTGIEHNLPVQNIYQDVLSLWQGTGVGYTPTHVVAYGGLSGEIYWYQHDEVWKNPRLSAFVPPHVLEPRARRREMAPDEDYNHIQAARIAKQLVDLGEIAQTGGHGQMAGICTHWELWMFVQGGMTPHESLRCGTLFGARYLGLDGDLGSLESGKLADLMILEMGRDATRDIRDSEKIQWVMANGHLYESLTMNEVGPTPRTRALLFWERGEVGPVAPESVTSGCVGCGRPGLLHAVSDG